MHHLYFLLLMPGNPKVQLRKILIRKNVERLERENITRRCTKTKSDKSRERRQNEDCMVIEEFEN